MMDTTARPSRSVPRGPPWEAGLRLDPAPSPAPGESPTGTLVSSVGLELTVPA